LKGLKAYITIKCISPNNNFEDVGLDVFDVDRTRVSASDQAPEIIAGHHQVALEAMHQLQEKEDSSIFKQENLKLQGLTSAVSLSWPTRKEKSVWRPFSRASSFRRRISCPAAISPGVDIFRR